MDSSATLSHHPKLIPKQSDTFFPSAAESDTATTTTTVTARKYPSSRRTPSFSSSSSSLSPYNSSSSLESFYFAADDPLLSSPSSPFRFSGVPFSWEHLPGIPKKQTSFSKMKLHQESCMKLLPLPPLTNYSTITNSSYNKKKNYKNSLQGDPFFAAMVECSKDIEDDHHHHHQEEEEEEEEEITASRSSAWWNNNVGGGSNNNNSKVSRSLSDRFGFINLYSSCKRASAVSESIIYLPSSRRRSTYHHFSRRSL